MKRRAPQGFTLIELSIVLVIIGLLIGGIVAGKTLIRTAELRKNVLLLQELNSAVLAFKLKYNVLPGDMTNATQLWGVKDDCQALHIRSTDGTTCNGDGNGIIATQSSEFPENHCVWQHLSNARLVTGIYSCSYGSGTSLEDYYSALDVPQAIGRGGYLNLYFGDPPFYGTHAYTFWAVNSDWDIDAPVFTPGEAHYLDSKMDDGKPNTGQSRILPSNECATGYGPEDIYQATVVDIVCNLSVKAIF